MTEDLEARADEKLRDAVAQLDLSHGRRTLRDAEHAFALLAQRLGLDAVPMATLSRALPLPARSVRRVVPWRSVTLWGAVAASVFGLSLVALGRTRLFRSHMPAASFTTYATHNGERANITLPDGSTAILNVASRLEVPTDFAAGHRTVRLVGEGMFSVLHRAGAPFSVAAGGDTTRVLGTSFAVRRYPSDTMTTVAVRTGKVGVRSLVLTAAQEAVLRRGVEEVRSVDATRFSFTSGVLSLNGVPLAAAVAELDRWYDADIRLGDSALATRRLVGEYAAGSLADLSDILAGTCNVRVVRKGRVLTLYPR